MTEEMARAKHAEWLKICVLLHERTMSRATVSSSRRRKLLPTISAGIQKTS